MKLNTILTDEEYMAQGFTKEECPLARELDELNNKAICGNATEEEYERIYELNDILEV